MIFFACTVIGNLQANGTALVTVSVRWSGLDDSERTTSTLTVNSCSPDWIRSNDTAVWGGTRLSAEKTQEQCLSACVANSRCVAVDWNKGKSACYIHEKHGYSYITRSGNTHFEIIRRCNTKSSTYHRHMFLLFFDRCCQHNHYLHF